MLVTDDEYADPTAQTPNVTAAPAAIWLVYGDVERDTTHSECYRDGDVGWCDEAQFAGDVRYVRADVAEAARDAAVVDALERSREYDDALLAAERERWMLLLTEKWHAGGGKWQTLAQNMGMTDGEYAAWVLKA